MQKFAISHERHGKRRLISRFGRSHTSGKTPVEGLIYRTRAKGPVLSYHLHRTGAPRLFLQVVNLEPVLLGRTDEPARNPFLHLG
jgi:hypothetical protein